MPTLGYVSVSVSEDENQFVIQLREGVTGIPYVPQDRGTSINHGFMDLKTHPELIASVPELQDCPELEELIRVINDSRSEFASIGCEKALFEVTEEKTAARAAGFTHEFGSYVDFVFAIRAKNTPEGLLAVARDISDFGSRAPSTYGTNVEFEGKRTKYGDTGEEHFLLLFRLVGFGSSPDQARKNWAAIVAVARDYFVSTFRE
jgi:hypothetical protein